MTDDAAPVDHRPEEILAFWEIARVRAGVVRLVSVTGPDVHGTLVPPTWSFGDNPALADSLLAAVLDGEKTGTSTALAEFRHGDESLPVRGDLSIIVDSAGHPAALIRTTAVETVRFDEVDEEFAASEGEDDRSLASWRVEHEKYWRRVLEPLGEQFSPEMPVVTERFELLYPRPSDRGATATASAH
ncbi:ASCH domain-containing protein [Cellulomonas endometrii]|uniref:ASCH domain-containing protein n=1 Tax=Cellulomonas endometrii TaxID=3036301 RepID=UPI0024ACC3F1|nr:ASCH domain-containing protein [Cellulomonas endometrii]